MFGGIFQRMILRELFKVFLLSLVGITGILLMAGIVSEATQHGLAPSQILAAIPLLIPSTLPYTIPATTLFATCVVYGRLAADNEILAIKAAGVNLYKVVMPGLVLGVIASAGTVLLYYRIIPYSHNLLREMVFRDAEELIYMLLKERGTVQQKNDAMWVRGVEGRKLIHPTFKRRKPDGSLEVVAQAREADLRVDLTKKVLLIRMRHGVASSEDGSHAYFDNKLLEIPLPENIVTPRDRRARAMTWEELQAKREEHKAERAEVVKEIRSFDPLLKDPNSPPLIHQHVEHLHHKVKRLDQKILHIKVEIIMRPALSVGCFFFILVGCPVGIWFSKSDFLSAFITCFLPIVCVYYPLLLSGIGMAKEGKLNPFLMVWGANLLIGCVGLILFAKLLRN